ncbi:hypothetical protein GMRT_24308 [Giardia muris]|uniref:Uncharacterized protein n=1 Tax=Giardia muris TaxID=5742 RepID=A0A4Z1T4D7_GIAMU|nr:hypothetical protein GMRT_24308 [Giardia muris]|eukprot:TNJ27291.1 hypothetical protein GMRT_24308 [Giardia muris]
MMNSQVPSLLRYRRGGLYRASNHTGAEGVGTVSLGDLLSGDPRVVLCLGIEESEYLDSHLLLARPEDVFYIHGNVEQKDDPEWYSSNLGSSTMKHFKLAPILMDKAGLMTARMLLVFHDTHLRLAFCTRGFSRQDWDGNSPTQLVWIQDFPILEQGYEEERGREGEREEPSSRLELLRLKMQALSKVVLGQEETCRAPSQTGHLFRLQLMTLLCTVQLPILCDRYLDVLLQSFAYDMTEVTALLPLALNLEAIDLNSVLGPDLQLPTGLVGLKQAIIHHHRLGPRMGAQRTRTQASSSSLLGSLVFDYDTLSSMTVLSSIPLPTHEVLDDLAISLHLLKGIFLYTYPDVGRITIEPSSSLLKGMASSFPMDALVIHGTDPHHGERPKVIVLCNTPLIPSKIGSRTQTPKGMGASLVLPATATALRALPFDWRPVSEPPGPM